jgi:phosphate transport system substrate-binding protein
MKVKKLVVTLTVLGSFLVAPTDSTMAAGAELSGTIKESGSTSVLPLAEAFALRFMELHPRVKVIYGGGGSGTGAKDCAKGQVDIGATSRELKISEADLISYPIARDGVAIIVHKDNPVDDLSLGEVARVYAGEITNWEGIGGKSGKIRLYSREEGSGTRDVFESKVMKERDISGRAYFKKSNGEIQTAIASDPGSIGYVSLGYIEGTKVLSIEGVKCTVESCKKGDYPLVRRLYFHTKGTPDEPVRAFIDFCRSEEGQKIVEELNYISLAL